MNILHESSKRIIVSFEEGEEKPPFLRKDDGHNKRRFYHFECGHCGIDYYARKSDKGDACSLSCAAHYKTGHLDNKKYKRDQYSPFRQYLRMAKRRNHKCTITLEYLRQLWEEQDGTCPYTGVKMLLPETTTDYQEVGHIWNKASLDRIDSAQGYIKGNVQFVAMAINFAKNSMPEDQLMEMIYAIKNN